MTGVQQVLEAFGLDVGDRRACSFAFSSKPALDGWSAFTFDAPAPMYFILAPGGKVTEVKIFVSGIKTENYVLVGDTGSQVLLVLRTSSKNQPLMVALRGQEDFDRALTAIRKFNFVSDVLTAHSSLQATVELLQAGAERYYINRGIFSSHYLEQRLLREIAGRGRNLQKEVSTLLLKFRGEIPTEAQHTQRMLSALGYVTIPIKVSGFTQYELRSQTLKLNAECVVAPVDSFDTKSETKGVPSYQAISALNRCDWVVLTNGRLWRLYYSGAQASSTNYFEIDLEYMNEGDLRLQYFVAIFSAQAFESREGKTDVGLAFEGSQKYAKEIEQDLRLKIFEGQLFLNLVRAVTSHSPSITQPQDELNRGKAEALKLLYRLLFILYAESRSLLPISNPYYQEISLESLRGRLPALDKQPDSVTCWEHLKRLFAAISKGMPEAMLPQYDGSLFEHSVLDEVQIKNKYLIPALQDLTETGGHGIDYQNLGVRHFGSLYEALLEYDVRQSVKDLVIFKEEILDAAYAADLKQKPSGYIGAGELYLSVGGLARKGTGSYFTPDAIVRFLARKGLGPHFEARQRRFVADMQSLREFPGNKEFEKRTVDDLLDFRIIDPAMGSGHFLVAAVDEITNWIITILKENPDAPLVTEIEQYRQRIMVEQSRKGIKLDESFLTNTVILKRMVMKRCIYGVDVTPLAVELAKLSLWLDSFTIGTPLTFLDHHIRCGDSLVGLWSKDVSPSTSQSTMDTWTWSMQAVGASMFEQVSLPPDLTIGEILGSRRAYEQGWLKTEPQRVIMDMKSASIIDADLGKKLPKNLAMIEEARSAASNKPSWWPLIEDARQLAEKFHVFHWELEFPDAFQTGRRGFDLLIMNPPWDTVKPEDDDFFSVYENKFRRITSKPEKLKVMKRLLKNPEISRAYEEYRTNIARHLRFYKESQQYSRQGSGDTNLWKLFLERSLSLLSDGGSLAILLPSGIVTDEGAKELREVLLNMRISALYEFENKNGIFPDIHRSYKFVLLLVEKAGPRESFPAAFYLHQMGALEGEETNKFVEMPLALIRLASPDTLSIPEVRNRPQLDVFSKMYKRHPLLGDEEKGWIISLVSELHRTNDSDLFLRNGRGWPLIEGKNFQQFLSDYERPSFTISPSEGLRRTAKHREYAQANERLHRGVRLAFRSVGRSTDARTIIACILPPKSFSPHSVTIVIPKTSKGVMVDERYSRVVAYLVGIMNSYVFDFLIRTRISANVSFFYIYQTPLPTETSKGISEEIVKIAVRLSSTDERFKDFARSFGIEAKSLKMKDRIELTAKLNALVAKHYGLNKDDLQIVLSSFDGFEEDESLDTVETVKWSDELIRRFNGEVRKRVYSYFDSL